MMLGIWRGYDELEEHLSMPELVALLNKNREKIQYEQKFLAAIQGIDLDGGSSDSGSEWEQLQARAYARARGESEDSASANVNDIMSLRGSIASRAGFGIGMGLDAEIVDGDGNVTKL